jgi:hypothetical protein
LSTELFWRSGFSIMFMRGLWVVWGGQWKNIRRCCGDFFSLILVLLDLRSMMAPRLHYGMICGVVWGSSPQGNFYKLFSLANCFFL